MNTNYEFIGRHPVLRDKEVQTKKRSLLDIGIQILFKHLDEPAKDLAEEFRHGKKRFMTALYHEQPKPMPKQAEHPPQHLMVGGIAAHETVQTIAVIDDGAPSFITMSDSEVDKEFETMLVRCL